MNKILVTGGCGYVGTPLVKFLSTQGFFVRVIDAQWFGNYHNTDERNVEILKKSVERIDASDLTSIDTVIHLANVANDPAV